MTTKKQIFLTGATGYLGSYVADVMLRETDVTLLLLTRARNREESVQRFWQAMQLHMDAATYYSYLDRVRFMPGDLTAPGLGLSAEDRTLVVEQAESVLHMAASLNRKSEKTCLNHNLRGTLSVIKLAREIQNHHGLRRFSHVSTVAVAGQRDSETLREDDAIEWERSDYDPYGRTKKFAEHMVRELLPDVQKTFLRPSIVMGDSRFAETSQFDMVRAFCVLVDLPILPFSGDGRVDIVNADWVGRAIAEIHLKDAPKHEIYHLSSGAASHRIVEIARALVASGKRKPPRFVPVLEGSFERVMDQLAGMKSKNPATLVGSLFKVFLPYITYDTVFLNDRAVQEIGLAPTPFAEYAARLYDYAKRVNYEYPVVPLPSRESVQKTPAPNLSRGAASA
ncbi:MAG: SDR family oxidoreductase [Sandaracinaceae bacterium]|nr:SDR family oxidoreductase [Sandaracinaceae bacterium]MBK8593883.1 SDR family oxidoreductase [Sandaracinaceae bacterium]